MHTKLIVGRYLDLPNFTSSKGADTPGGPEHFVTTPGRNYQIAISTKQRVQAGQPKAKSSSMVPGHRDDRIHRNFRWLHWQPGKITYLPLAGPDILTGPMSGCWIVTFRMNDIQYVGHIGTEDSPVSANSVQVKAAWAAAFQAGQVVATSAFKPNRLVAMDIFSKAFGVVTEAGGEYALRLWRGDSSVNFRQIVQFVATDGAGVVPHDDGGEPNFVVAGL